MKGSTTESDSLRFLGLTFINDRASRAILLGRETKNDPVVVARVKSMGKLLMV